MGTRALFALALTTCAACGGGGSGGDGVDISQPGGMATVTDRTAMALTHEVVGLDEDTIATAHAGNGQFDFEWETPALGPIFNNTACINCHTGNGRGLDEVGPNTLTGSQGLVRVSLATGTPTYPGGPVPVPDFGLQLQDHADPGIQEVNLVLTWMEQPGTYADGTAFSLRTPMMDITTPDGVEFRSDALRSFRQAPAAVGLGLLAAVPDDVILDGVGTEASGVAGHPNMVWDVVTATTVIGRFGVKANQSTLGQQVNGAFANDIGITNTMFPDPSGSTEVGDTSVNAVITFLTTLAVPAPAPQTDTTNAGHKLFSTLGCTSCHTETLVTGDSPIAALANQTIHPFTDLLVHDMGTGLADGRPDFTATGSEYRTQPLWGLGLAQVINAEAGFLHDGRARTIEEAVLWHGGEAQAAQAAFVALSKSDRDALLAFLASL